MFLILLFTILGFVIGLTYVMKTRNIRPSKILAAAFLAALSAAIYKIIKDFSNKNYRKKRGF